MSKGLTAAKAKKILEDGKVRGKALTEKQKKFFGAVAGGATPLKKLNGGWLDKFQNGGDVSFDSVQRAVRNVESLDGKLMWNPESTATGLYGQLFSQVKDDYSGTRKEFAQDTIAQKKFFKDRFFEGLPSTQTTSLVQDANDIYNEYAPQISNFNYSKEDLAVLSNFLGRQGTRNYLGYHVRDKKPLEEALPNIYGSDAKQRNKTPQQYLKQARKYYKEGGWLEKFDNGGVQPNYNDSNVSLPPGFKGYGYDKGGRAYNGAWDGPVTRMGGTIPGATGMTYARTSGTSPEEPKKAQDGTVMYGTPEYEAAYREGRFANVPNPLGEVVIDSGVDYNQYPLYDKLSAQQKEYFNDPGPIGRGVRRAAQTDRGLAEDTYDVVNPIMYGALGVAGGMAFAPQIATLGRAAVAPIGRALNYKPFGGPVSIGNVVDAGSAAYAAYATPEAYRQYQENPNFDTGLDLALTSVDLVPFSEIFTGGKNIRKAYNYTSDQISNIFKAKPKGINLETTPLRDAVTQPNIYLTSSPLPKSMEPYLSKRVYPFNKEQEIFESFLPIEAQLKNIDSKSLYYDQAGKRITKAEADNLLYPPEYQKNGGEVDKAQLGRILKWGKDIYDGFNTADNVVDVANTVRKTSKVVDNAWAVKPLPGLHLKSTMDNGAISKIIESKTGLINTEQALAIINKESGGAEKVALIRQQLGDNIPKKIDYNNFRKITQESLIPLEVKINPDGRASYGLDHIGYGEYWDDGKKLADVGILENNALTISNRNQFGGGSSMHGNPDDTLGHVHFLRDVDNPQTLTVTQIQSDAFQGGYATMPKTKEAANFNIAQNEKHLENQKRIWNSAVQQPDSSWLYPDGSLIPDGIHKLGLQGQESINAMQRAEAANLSQKQLLKKNHQERYLQEIVNYAAQRGDLNKVRIPTMETAAKIQNYTSNMPGVDGGATSSGFNLSDYGGTEQSILKKYKDQSKNIKKLYGQDAIIVTDGKGNTWYEFDIPESFKSGKGEIKAFEEGGSTPKAQYGLNEKFALPFRDGVLNIKDDQGKVIGESSHIMKTETDGKGNWFSFPTLFQDEDGTWVDMSEQAKIDWKPVYEEAKKRGEVIDFGTDEKGALEFGEGSWKSPKMKNGGWLSKYENGGVIEDDRGQWAHPGKVTKINSNNITMKGVNYPVLGISDTGDKKMMQPGKDYKFDGNSVTEFPMAQKGMNVEGQNQRKWFDSYIRSDKYLERLGKEFPDMSADELANERWARLMNMRGTPIGFLPESSDISPTPDHTQGVYNADEYPGNIMLRPEYSEGRQGPWSYNTIPLHEMGHAVDEGGKRIPQTTLDFLMPKLKQNPYDIPKETFYYTRPTEYINRLQPLRYLLQEEGIYDAKKKDFTKEDLQKAKENTRIKYNTHFEDLMENTESEEDFIEIMNTIAARPQMQQNTMVAKDGKSLVELNQLTNFTNYNTPQPGGWLDKY